MKLKTVVKIGTIISVLMFCLAVLLYSLNLWDSTARNREVNLFSLIPSHTVSVLETDNIYGFLNEISIQEYGDELKKIKVLGQFNFILQLLNEYADRETHGLSSKMNRMLVSLHESDSLRDWVVYIGLGNGDEKLMKTILQNITSTEYLSKEESYRGKLIEVYPLSNDEYLTTYSEAGFVALSLQKRLIEQVIDAHIDGKSLNDDSMFSEILSKRKSKQNLVLYARTSELPFLTTDTPCWSEYDFHLNSDVFYLTGETYLPDNIGIEWKENWQNTCYSEDEFFLTSDNDSVSLYMDRVYEEDLLTRSLFKQCIANLSKDASFSLIADLQKIKSGAAAYSDCFPSTIKENISLLEPFVLSLQYFQTDNQFSHIWVFTYKN